MAVIFAISSGVQQVSVRTMGANDRQIYLQNVLQNTEADMIGKMRATAQAGGSMPSVIAAASAPISPGYGTIQIMPYTIAQAALTSRGGTATTFTNTTMADQANPDPEVQGATAAIGPIAPRYNVQVEVKNTAPDGTIDDLIVNCQVRINGTPVSGNNPTTGLPYSVSQNYADIVACTPRNVDPTVGSQVATDNADQIYPAPAPSASPADTTAYKYDVCSSTSGGCAWPNAIQVSPDGNHSLIPRARTATTQSSIVSGAKTW